MNNELFIQQGWQCPVCGRVMGPSALWCYWCADKQTTAVSNVTVRTVGTPVRDIMVDLGKTKKEDDDDE